MKLNEIKKVKIEGHLKKGKIYTLLQRENRNLKYIEEYDQLTGIYNKNKFFRETSKILKENLDCQFVIVRLDIQHFKIINDIFGSREGDKILCYIAKRINEIVKMYKIGSCCRMEGDIFYICFPYTEEKTSEIIERLQRIILDYEINFELMLYFGLYVIEDHYMPIDLMCDRANLALRTVKGNYVTRYAFYDESLRRKIIHEQEIVREMNDALINNQFQIYLQPKYHLANNKIIGAEALVRWIHPEKGIIPPMEFIPIFEQNGFIMKLDYYVWEMACKLLRKWIDEGRNIKPISVNVSKVNLYNPNLCDNIINLVKKYNISPKLLELELTESAYTDNPDLLNGIMTKLQSYGFTIMMDDFGSGYSSLNMLKDVSVDILKIDLRFLSGEDKTGRGGNILASVIRMAKWLNLPVIAEGIETKEQADFLLSIGCIDGQGYYFAKPMPVELYEKSSGFHRKTSLADEEIRLNTEIDIEELWNPNKNNNVFFNSMISAVGIYEMDNGHLEAIRLNDSYFEMIGCTRKDFYYNGLHVFDWIFEEDKEIVTEMFNQAIRNREIGEAIYRRKTPNGDILWLHTKVRYLAGNDNRYLFFAALNDITHKTILSNNESIIFELDIIKDVLVYIRNRKGYRKLTKVVENHSEKFANNILHPEDKGILNDFEEKVKANVSEGQYNFRANLYNEGFKSYTVVFSIIEYKGNKPSKILGSVEEIPMRGIIDK